MPASSHTLRLFSDEAGEGNSDGHGSSDEESSSDEYNSEEDSAGSLIDFIVDSSSCSDSEDVASQLSKDQQPTTVLNGSLNYH